MRNRQEEGGLYKVLHNFALDLTTRRHILMAVLGPSLEYGCEVQACKYILECSVTTCDEVVCVDLPIETLKYRRDFCKPKY